MTKRLPARYLAGLPRTLRKQRERELAALRETEGYAEPPTDAIARERGLVRESAYTTVAKRRGIEWRGTSANRAAAARNMARRVLRYYGAGGSGAEGAAVAEAIEASFDRGLAAWKTGGHRPGATGGQWAVARVNSLVLGGKTARTADRKLFAAFPDTVRRKIEAELPEVIDALRAQGRGADVGYLMRSSRASGPGEHAAAALPHQRTRLRRIREAARAGAHGRGWYTDAENEIALVARAWGVSPEYVAVAVAATSPATPVIASPRMQRGGGKASNIGKARATIKGIVARGIGGTPLKPTTPGLSRLRAFEECVAGGGPEPTCVEVAFPDPEHVKTHAFVRNLLGIEDAVTVDRQVAKVVYGEPDARVTERQYQLIVQDIRAVARELGWTPREVMAAVWTAAGGSGALRLATDRERAIQRRAYGTKGGHAEARVSLRAERDGAIVLYHGTSIENLPGILGSGLSPSGGRSPHNTKTRSATFFTDDRATAFIYSNGGAVLEVDVTGLDIEPDYDDAGYLLDQVADLNRAIGADLALGDPIPDELTEAVEDYLQSAAEEADGYDWGLSTSVEDGVLVLTGEPYVGMRIEASAYQDDPELYDERDMRWDDWGVVQRYSRQYLCSCRVPPDRIRRVLVPEELLREPWTGSWAGIKDYNKVEPDPDSDHEEGGRFIFPVVRFAAMTLDQARAAFGVEVGAVEGPMDEGVVAGHWGSRASGILFVAEGRVLLLRRAPGTHTPGVWSIPGGAIPRYPNGAYEDALKSARAEAEEEVGHKGGPVIGSVDYREDRTGFTYTTFVVAAPRRFEPRLQWEHVAARWVLPEDAEALDLHPAFRAVWPELRRIGLRPTGPSR